MPTIHNNPPSKTWRDVLPASPLARGVPTFGVTITGRPIEGVYVGVDGLAGTPPVQPVADLQKLFDRAVELVNAHHERDPSIASSIDRNPHRIEINLHFTGSVRWMPMAAWPGEARTLPDGRPYTVHRWTDPTGVRVVAYRDTSDTLWGQDVLDEVGQ